MAWRASPNPSRASCPLGDGRGRLVGLPSGLQLHHELVHPRPLLLLTAQERPIVKKKAAPVTTATNTTASSR